MRFLSSGAACLVGLVGGAALLGALGALAACASDASPKVASGDGGTTPSSSGTPTTTTANVTVTTESVTVNGQARVYLLAVPTGIDTTKTLPLVMDLHGSPGSAASQAGDGFDAVSGKSAIIVYPQALAEDSGAFSWDLGNEAAKNEDVALLEALPNALKTKGIAIDPTKIFGYGYSGGAFFLQVYQCLGPKVFRAISSSAGGSPDSLRSSLGPADNDKCVACPGTPVPELIVFGQLDDSKGGDFQALCAAQASGCDANNLTATTPAPCRTYNGCPAERPLEYCSVPGLDHGNWSEAIPTTWSFFKTYL